MVIFIKASTYPKNSCWVVSEYMRKLYQAFKSLLNKQHYDQTAYTIALLEIVEFYLN